MNDFIYLIMNKKMYFLLEIPVPTDLFEAKDSK